ncbi:hypothetical protein MKZ38_004733 [Zalerion maritima]|uniref:Uncharacterized protein n=1 Tax=Zalerion maritima TaxID=339359 RepID=A0AAD5WUE0_9PEZI|nr:hypothetical protein MKZ38_004733 [Zalerion maritima]
MRPSCSLFAQRPDTRDMETFLLPLSRHILKAYLVALRPVGQLLTWTPTVHVETPVPPIMLDEIEKRTNLDTDRGPGTSKGILLDYDHPWHKQHCPVPSLQRLEHIFHLIYSISVSHFAANLELHAAHSLIRTTSELVPSRLWHRRVQALMRIEEVFTNARHAYQANESGHADSTAIQNDATHLIDSLISLRHKQVPITEEDEAYIRYGCEQQRALDEWKKWEGAPQKPRKINRGEKRRRVLAKRKDGRPDHDTENDEDGDSVSINLRW